MLNISAKILSKICQFLVSCHIILNTIKTRTKTIFRLKRPIIKRFIYLKLPYQSKSMKQYIIIFFQMYAVIMLREDYILGQNFNWDKYMMERQEQKTEKLLCCTDLFMSVSVKMRVSKSCLNRAIFIVLDPVVSKIAIKIFKIINYCI